MKTFKDLIKLMFQKDMEFVFDKKIPKSIYGKGNEVKKKLHFFHFIFKYKFLVPILFIAEKFINKLRPIKIGRKHHNRNISIFNKSFNSSVLKWSVYYRRNAGPKETRKGYRFWSKRIKKAEIKSYKLLKILRDSVILTYLNDTAYREFFNILMHEIAINMVKEYSRGKNKTKKTGHLFFSTDIYDVNYYTLEKTMRYKIEYGITDCEKEIEKNGKLPNKLK
jgi:hypothetical protein